MTVTAAQATELIRKRRSIYPNTYVDRPIPREIVEELLVNANYAPTHKLTEPWRFRVFYSEQSRQRLSEYLGDWYEANTLPENFKERKLKKTRFNPVASGCVIAIILQRDPEARVPEWEEVAAVSCAVQNIWLTCSAHQIGCYWSSPRSIIEAREFLELGNGERCLGLLYMGYHELPDDLPAKRTPIEDKVVWL